MVVIRLARKGAKKRPFYNIIVSDKRARRDGRFIERVGYFNPVAQGKETKLLMNNERITYWVSKGAQLSVRVASLLQEWQKENNA